MSFMLHRELQKELGTRSERKLDSAVCFFAPREAGHGDDEKTPDSDSINNVTN